MSRHLKHVGKLHPFTRSEIARGVLDREILHPPRRCENGHLCQLWPCITCEAVATASARRTMKPQLEPPRCLPATEKLAAIRDHQAEICRLAGELPSFNPEHWRFARRIEELTMLTLDAIDQAAGELQEQSTSRR